MDTNDLTPEPGWDAAWCPRELQAKDKSSSSTWCWPWLWGPLAVLINVPALSHAMAVFAHCSLIMSHLTAVLILLYEWQRFPKKLDRVPLSPLSPHISFPKCAISSYLYTLIICVKSSYLNHLHCWLAPSPWLAQLSPASPAMLPYVGTFTWRCQVMGNFPYFSSSDTKLWQYAGKDFAIPIIVTICTCLTSHWKPENSVCLDKYLEISVWKPTGCI